MSVSSLGSVRAGGAGRFCPGCHQAKLRSNEQHSCFDCLSHDALSLPELKCEICVGWLPRHFVQATAYYPSDSPARMAALAFEDNVKAVQSIPFPGVNPPPPPPPLTPRVVVQVQEDRVMRECGSGNPPPPLEGGSTQISQEHSVFLDHLFRMFKGGPQLPGLSALLQTGVPIGVPASSLPLIPAPAPEQVLMGKGIRKVAKKKQVVPSSSSVSGALQLEESELVNARQKSSSNEPLIKKRKTSPLSDGPGDSDLSCQGDSDGIQDNHDRDSTGNANSRSSPRSVAPLGMVITEANFADHLDRAMLGSSRLSSNTLGPLTDRHDRPQCGGDQVQGQSSSASSTDRGGLGADRVSDRASSHDGSSQGQTRPKGATTIKPGFQGSRSGDRSLPGKTAISFPYALRQGMSAFPDRDLDQGNDIEMEPDSRVSREDLAAESGSGESVFRWALESIALRMGEELPKVQPAVGKGSFATTTQTPFLSLPVSSNTLKKMEEVNRLLSEKVEPGKADGWVPPISIPSASSRVYATRPTGANDLVTGSPSDDRLLGALRKQTTPVWSAYVKKARLLLWQNAAHQLMGQVSLMDNLTKFVDDLLLESTMLASEREQVAGAVSVIKSTLGSAARLSTNLAAQLDLTARDAELRMLDLTEFQQAMFRASPLFSGELFGGITRATVEDITSSRMMSDIHTIAGKGGSKGQASAPKGKKANQKTATQPSRVVQPFRGQAAVPQSGQQPGTNKKGGKGGKGKNKSKR